MAGVKYKVYFTDGNESNVVYCYDEKDLNQYYKDLVSIYGLENVKKVVA